MYVSINSGAGNDSIYNFGYRVTIDSGAGDDTIRNYYGYSSINDGAGNDSIYSDSYATIDGGEGNDTISAYSGSVAGGEGNDRISLHSSYARATVNGGKGNDSIYAVLPYSFDYGRIYQYASGDGNDVIYNFSSYDTLHTTQGTVSEVSAIGTDVVMKIGDGSIMLKDYIDTSTITTVSWINAAGEQMSTVVGFSNSWEGTSKADEFINYQNGYEISALAGNDTVVNSGDGVTIDAGAGNDIIKNGYFDDDGYFVDGGVSVSIDGGAGNDTIFTGNEYDNYLYTNGGDGNDYIYGYHNVFSTALGGKGNDTITGNYWWSSINGGAGKDVISIQTLDDHGIDMYNTIIGGTDNDTISLDEESTHQLIQYANGDGKDVIIGFNSTDTIQITSGSLKSTVMSGSDLVMNIGNGSITLKDVSGGMAFTLINANGNVSIIEVPKIMYGTAKNDTLKNDVEGSQIYALAGNDTIQNIGWYTSISGDTGNDLIQSGGEYDGNWYEAGEGNSLDGAKGNDTVMAYSIWASTITGGAGNDSIQLIAASDNIIEGGDGIDTINILGVGYNTISGGNGNDLIQSGGEYDGNWYEAGEGNSLDGAKGNDTVMAYSIWASTITGGAGNDVISLSGEYEDEKYLNTISGGAGNDTIYTNSYYNVYQYASGDGNDVILGFHDDDTIQITSGSIKSASLNGSDFVMNIGNGSLTLKEVTGGTAFTLIDSKGVTSTYEIPKEHALTAKNDTFVNEDNEYRVYALAGNDTVENYGEAVTIDGGAGNDYLFNDSNMSSILGGAGNDTIEIFGKKIQFPAALEMTQFIVTALIMSSNMQMVKARI